MHNANSLVVASRHFRCGVQYLEVSFDRLLFIFFWACAEGFKALTIEQLLREEKLRCSHVGVDKFLKRFRKQAASAGGLDLGDHQR